MDSSKSAQIQSASLRNMALKNNNVTNQYGIEPYRKGLKDLLTFVTSEPSTMITTHPITTTPFNRYLNRYTHKLVASMGRMRPQYAFHHNNLTMNDAVGQSKTGYIYSFVFIFFLVVLSIIGCVIYSATATQTPSHIYLNYQRAMSTPHIIITSEQSSNQDDETKPIRGDTK